MLSFFYISGYSFALQTWSGYNFLWGLSFEPSTRLRQGPAAELTAPIDGYLYFRIILWFFFTKYNIQKLNLLSTDISKNCLGKFDQISELCMSFLSSPGGSSYMFCLLKAGSKTLNLTLTWFILPNCVKNYKSLRNPHPISYQFTLMLAWVS